MKKGVLLVNLGTPKTPTARDVRAFLKRFLSDQRVIDMPAWQWQPILHMMVLPHRPARSAALYQQIWSKDFGSPLLHYTSCQAEQLQAELPDYQVRYAMSYSDPLISRVLTQFEADEVDDLTIIPLYPQYSTTTVGSVIDDVNRFYYRRVNIPNLHIVTDFSEFPPYLAALAAKIKGEIESFQPDQVLISYHGIPKRYVEKGDPYQARCQLTTQHIIEKIKPTMPVMQTYQSKFGPGEWLTPATDATLKSLPAKQIKRVLIVSPSFTIDCLETLNELDIENRGYFMASGGTEFRMVPALNDDKAFTDMLRQLVLSYH